MMVYIHIQKTGGTTFGRALINNLRDCVPFKETSFDKSLPFRSSTIGDKTNSLRKAKGSKKHCYRNEEAYKLEGASKYDTWLVSRLSTGWDCGVHASYTAVQECLPKILWKNLGKERYNAVKRNTYFITSIRNPIDRFISEWKHYGRGATWHYSRMICNGREYENDLEKCFETDWKNVPLDEFLNCRYNLASNRQVRMLANLGHQCYFNVFPTNTSDPAYHHRMKVLLESAKGNLEYHFSFFLINEHRLLSQYLFESTFGVYFYQLDQIRF